MHEGTATIRVSRSAHEQLRRLAEADRTTITAVVDLAVKELQTRRFWDDFRASVAALQADPAALAEYRAEAESWDATLSDGLEPEGP